MKFSTPLKTTKTFMSLTFILMVVNASSQSLIDKPLPFFKGIFVNGDSIVSSDLKGKVTLIQFLYIGCIPCMHEVPYYNELIKDFDKKDFDLFAICPETINNLRAFMADDTTSPFHVMNRIFNIKIEYKIVAECNEQAYSVPPFRPQCSTISEKFHLSGYPLSILVDKKGIIRKVYSGFPIDDTDEEKQMIYDLKKDILNLCSNN